MMISVFEIVEYIVVKEGNGRLSALYFFFHNVFRSLLFLACLNWDSVAEAHFAVLYSKQCQNYQVYS